MDKTKNCKSCNTQKLEYEFSKWRGSCKSCLAKKQDEYRNKTAIVPYQSPVVAETVKEPLIVEAVEEPQIIEPVQEPLL